jgi:hypothetical protein
MPPFLREIDLRPAFYVSRGADQTFVHGIKLSRQSRELIEVFRKNPKTVDTFGEQIRNVPSDEVSAIMNSVVEQLRTSSKDDFHHRLNGCVTFVKAHPSQESLLVSALKSLDPSRFTPASIAVVREQKWAPEIEKDLKGKLESNSPVLKAFKKGK